MATLMAVTALQLVLHPDITPLMQVSAVAALAAGWIFAGQTHAIWLALAPLAPALMLVAAARQGPVADSVWMAGLTGALLRTLSWSRWTLPPFWTALLGGWALILAFSWPVLLARELEFDAQSLRDVSTATSWAMMSAPQVVAWTLYVVQTHLLGLLWFDWAAGSLLTSAAARLPRAVHALWIGVTIASFVALVQGTVDITFLNTIFWAEAMRATGTMLDANAYGVAAALAGPVGFLAVGQSTTVRLAGSVLVLAANWGGVWMSSSRTGFLCALLGAAGLIAGLAQTPHRVMTRGRSLMLAGAAAAVAVVVVFGAAVGPLQRVAAMELNIEELWTRGGYGTIADSMVRDYPLIGVGVGAYRYLAPDYWREIFDAQLQLDNAQNWWRHQAAELGIAGGSLILLWSVTVAWLLFAGAAARRDALRAWTVRGLLAGLAAISLVGVPTQNPVVLLWFYFVVAWLAALAPARPVGNASPRLLKAIWTAAVVFTFIYVTGHLLAAQGPLTVAERAHRFGRDYVVGAYPPEPLPDGGEFRWTDEEARFILAARGNALLIRLWAHHPDIGEHPVTFTIASRCGQVLQRELRSAAPIVIGVLVPADVLAVDASIRVSHTWTPAEGGGSDTRRLGIAVSTDVVDPELAMTRDYVVVWPVCGGASSG
jgi:hypothetical protein